MKKDSSAEACLICHQALEARPKDFPQIENIEKHMKDQEQEMEEGISCIDCHSAHEPA